MRPVYFGFVLTLCGVFQSCLVINRPPSDSQKGEPVSEEDAKAFQCPESQLTPDSVTPTERVGLEGFVESSDVFSTTAGTLDDDTFRSIGIEAQEPLFTPIDGNTMTKICFFGDVNAACQMLNAALSEASSNPVIEEARRASALRIVGFDQNMATFTLEDTTSVIEVVPCNYN